MKESNPLNSTGRLTCFAYQTVCSGWASEGQDCGQRLEIPGLFNPSWIPSRENFFLFLFLFLKRFVYSPWGLFSFKVGDKSLNFTLAFLSDREVTDQHLYHMDLPRQNNICFSWVHHSVFLRIVSFYASFRTFLSCFAKRRVHLFFLPTALDTFSRSAYTRAKWLSTILHIFKASSHAVASTGKSTTQEEV